MPFLAKEHFPIPNKDILSWMLDDVQYDQDKPIYIDGLNPSRYYSARTARTLIRQLAAGFHSIGVKPGDCVCIHSFNDICYPLFFSGLLAAGGVFAGTNPAYTAHELTHTLKTAKVKFVLTQPDLLKGALQAAKENGIPKERIIIFNPKGEKVPEGFLQWSDLLKHGERDWVKFDSYDKSYNTGAARLFSSGTTGLPKAAEMSHYNLVAQHTLVFESYTRPWVASRIIMLPMFHAAMAPYAFCGPLRSGESCYIYPRFDLAQFLQGHEKYQITDLSVVPPVVVMAANSPLSKPACFSTVRLAACGAAPLDPALQARMSAFFPKDVPFTQVWGMTETSCICTRFAWPEHDDTGSIGRPLPNIDMKLVDDAGKDISDYNVRGEICVRGPTIIRGYFDNPDANARDWDADRYFHTGDIGYVDRDTGKWYIVDRKKELIKVRGNQVAPPEVEGVLLSHPSIVDCGVIGVPDSTREGDELPRAYIVRRDPKSSSPSKEDVAKWVSERLASFKKLEGGIVFVDAIPKNASGKILKKTLREWAKKEMRQEKKAKL